MTKGSVIGSGSTKDGCSANGSSLTVYYSGSANGPSLPADAVIASDIPSAEFFNFIYGLFDSYNLLYNAPADTTTVVDELQTTCPGGGAPCAYYQPALSPFLATLTSLGSASAGEPGSPAVWLTDNNTGLVGGITANGTFTLYPTDGIISGPPHSADPSFPDYSVPYDLGGGNVLIPNYASQNLVEFKANPQTFDVLRPAYTSAGLASPVGAAPSVFVPDGTGALWFVDPNTAAIDTATATGSNVVSCAFAYSDQATPVAGNALAVAGTTVWTSTVATTASSGLQFYLARFPTSVATGNPCTVPFSDEIPLTNEVDRLAVDPSGNAWFVDNGGNLGYVPAGGGTPATQTFPNLPSSNLLAAGKYLYALDSLDGLLLRIDTTTPPPNAVVASAPIPASWAGTSNNPQSFDQIWLTAGPGTSIWFAANPGNGGLRSESQAAFAIDPAQLTFNTAARTRGRSFALRSHRHVTTFRRPHRSGPHFPIVRSKPNFGR